MTPDALIIIHGSATPNGRWHTIDDLDAWHQARGKHRLSRFIAKHQPHLPHIGYHHVITTDGAIADGRSHAEPAGDDHAYNRGNISICLIGTNKYTPAQWDSLATLVSDLRAEAWYDVIGHHSLDANKACPGFDVGRWLADRMRPRPEHTLEA